MNENDGSVNLTIGVLFGTIQRDVVLSLSTTNGTALCKVNMCVIHIHHA